MELKEIKQLTKESLLKVEDVKEAYDDLIEQIIKVAKSGSLNTLIHRENYDDLTFTLLLRVLTLDGYELKYFYTNGEEKGLRNVNMVNIYWGGNIIC